jgi:chemotaxis protein MotB
MSLPPLPPRKSEDNEWMLTYADVITLLLAFFVILFSMSTLKKDMFSQIQGEIVEGQYRSLAQKIQALNPNKEQVQSPTVYRVFIPPLGDDDFLHTVVGIDENNKNHQSELTFPEEVLFKPGTTSLINRSKIVMEQTVEYLSQVSPSYFLIAIEVHYDKESATPHSYLDKFQFTAERALNIRMALEKEGYPFENIYIVGYGDSIPLKTNLDIDSAHPERRIIINIHRKTDIR